MKAKLKWIVASARLSLAKDKLEYAKRSIHTKIEDILYQKWIQTFANSDVAVQEADVQVKKAELDLEEAKIAMIISEENSNIQSKVEWIKEATSDNIYDLKSDSNTVQCEKIYTRNEYKGNSGNTFDDFCVLFSRLLDILRPIILDRNLGMSIDEEKISEGLDILPLRESGIVQGEYKKEEYSKFS
jgi:hypothetical protein